MPPECGCQSLAVGSEGIYLTWAVEYQEGMVVSVQMQVSYSKAGHTCTSALG